ncbi:hypothetical protein [Caulobacter sp. DWP3-1-3b2]|uniref:hypothetical protein n=1 Tax=Caulobacter sp. DWP3-1-3b2 TaxID=2804643 RepID=UPI003CEC7983
MRSALSHLDHVTVEILDHDAVGSSVTTIADSAALEDLGVQWLNRSSAPIDDALKARIETAVAGKIVIGFELPATLSGVIQASAVALLNLAIHPCRFLDDLLLLGASNHPVFAAALERAKSDERELFWAAGLLRCRISGSATAPEGLEAGRLALIAGQMAMDRALINDGRFVSLADFADRIGEIAKDHDLLLARAHPYAGFDVASALELVKIPNLRFTTSGTYALLASGRIATVVAVSSSLLHEACYFGVAAEALAPGASHGFPLSPELTAFRAQALPGAIADAVAVLTGREPSGGPPVLALGGAALRGLIEETWGLTGINHVAPMLPAATLPDMRVSGNHPSVVAGLVSGWCPPEDWGVWADGAVATFAFDWREAYGKGVVLAVDLASFPASPDATQEVEIWVEGVRITTVAAPGLHRPVRAVFTVTRPRYPGPVQMHFVVREPLSAAGITNGEDARKLGVGLIGIASLI